MAPIAPLGPISALPLMPVGLPGVSDAAPAAQAPSDAFAGMLSSAVSSLNDQLVNASDLSQKAASGQLPDPTQAILEIEKADISFQLATQVRNKLVESWQEINRMSV